MKKNLFLMAVAAVVAILVSLTSCGNGNDNKALKGDEVAITLPSSQPMVIKTGFYGDIYKAGAFASKDGKNVHVEYCITYSIQDE
jgi:hypothetical protein